MSKPKNADRGKKWLLLHRCVLLRKQDEKILNDSAAMYWLNDILVVILSGLIDSLKLSSIVTCVIDLPWIIKDSLLQ